MASASRHHSPGCLEGLAPLDGATSQAAALDLLLAACGESGCRGPTPYTGTAGLALALHAASALRPELAARAAGLGQASLAALDSRPGYWPRGSLLDGEAGVLAVAALTAPAAAAQQGETAMLLHRYTAICREAAAAAESDEVLYGRAGLLLGALQLRRQLGPGAVPDAALAGLAQAILASGRALAARARVFAASGCPLAYAWPPGHQAQPYLGAAHGLMGILYALLHCQRWTQADPQAAADIEASLRFVLACERDMPGMPPGSGGHWPTLMPLRGLEQQERAALVQWCHGAPGAVFLFCRAHEVLGEPAGWLAAALRAGKLVWRAGLLKKGPGLCHGVSGNAFALLRLWRTTQDPTWLARARLFAAFMVSPAGRADWAAPDHPGSLFEGAAGGLALVAQLAGLTRGSGAQAALPGMLRGGGFPLFEVPGEA